MIVFPELSLSGFECPERCAMHRDLAEPIPWAVDNSPLGAKQELGHIPGNRHTGA